MPREMWIGGCAGASAAATAIASAARIGRGMPRLSARIDPRCERRAECLCVLGRVDRLQKAHGVELHTSARAIAPCQGRLGDLAAEPHLEPPIGQLSRILDLDTSSAGA